MVGHHVHTSLLLVGSQSPDIQITGKLTQIIPLKQCSTKMASPAPSNFMVGISFQNPATPFYGELVVHESCTSCFIVIIGLLRVQGAGRTEK